jgi:hypothetical protein
MKELIFLVAFIAICCIAYLIYEALKGVYTAAQAKLHDEWEVSDPEVLDDGTTQIYITRGRLVRPFGEPIGGNLAEYAFQEKLEETKVAAQSRCDALNRRLSA